MTRNLVWKAALVATPVLVLSGCGGNQNTLAPEARPERAITNLFWVDVRRLVLRFRADRRSCSSSAGGDAASRRCRSEAASGPRRWSCIGMGVALPVVAARRALRLVGRLRRSKSTAAPAAGTTAMTIQRDRPPVVVGGALHGHACGHGERDPHPGRHAGRCRRHDRRRDPQLLGPGAEPEDRHDPGLAEPHPARRRQARASTAASAPSSAGCSTRTWRCDVVAQPRARIPARGSRAGTARGRAERARAARRSSSAEPARAATRSAAPRRTATSAPT